MHLHFIAALAGREAADEKIADAHDDAQEEKREDRQQLAGELPQELVSAWQHGRCKSVTSEILYHNLYHGAHASPD